MPVTFPSGANYLAQLKAEAIGGNIIATVLLGIMEGSQTASLSPGTQSSRTIRLSGQVKDQDGVLIAAAREVLVRLRMPLLTPGTQVDLATAAALPACTAAGTGVGKTLTGNVNAALTVDGIAVTNGLRVLVQNQATAKDNGVYTQTQLGTGSVPFILTRATDFDAVSVTEIAAGANYRVAQGATNAGKTFVHTTIGTIVADTTSLVFFDFGLVGTLNLGAAGATIHGGANTKDLFLAADASGAFSVDILSQMAGNHLIEVIVDNGQAELLVLSFT